MDLDKIKEELEAEYVLLKKKTWWSFLGGALAFLIAVGVVSYQSALGAARSKAATDAVNRIKQLKDQAESDAAEIARIKVTQQERLATLEQNIHTVTTRVDQAEKRADQIEASVNAVEQVANQAASKVVDIENRIRPIRISEGGDITATSFRLASGTAFLAPYSQNPVGARLWMSSENERGNGYAIELRVASNSSQLLFRPRLRGVTKDPEAYLQLVNNIGRLKAREVER